MRTKAGLHCRGDCTVVTGNVVLNFSNDNQCNLVWSSVGLSLVKRLINREICISVDNNTLLDVVMSPKPDQN